MKKLLALLAIIFLTSCAGFVVYDDYYYDRPVHHQEYRVVTSNERCPVCQGSGRIIVIDGPRYDRHHHYRARRCDRCGGTGRVYVRRVYNRYLY